MQVEREVKATGTWHRSKINKQAQTNDALGETTNLKGKPSYGNRSARLREARRRGLQTG